MVDLDPGKFELFHFWYDKVYDSWAVRGPKGHAYMLYPERIKRLVGTEEPDGEYLFMINLKTGDYGVIPAQIEIVIKDAVITKANLVTPLGHLIKADIQMFDTWLENFL